MSKGKTILSGICQQNGFSLVEVLVSVVILSIGLLGLAGIQATAYRINHDSFIRSLAVSQVDAIIDRMRANKQGRLEGFYTPADTGGETAGANLVDCEQCTPQQLASNDLYTWNSENRELLPSGQGNISHQGNIFMITIRYDKDRTGATGTNCSGNSAIDLTCIKVSVEL